MIIKNRFTASLALATAFALPVLTNGCSSDVSDLAGAACCTEFKAGEAVDVKISGNVQAQVAVQAVSDLSGVATASIADLTGACRNIAQDLGASKTDADAAEAKSGSEQMKAWCTLAVNTITKVKGNATLKVEFDEPKCSASISAKANCQAKCSGSASCDLKANPPTCKGGSLEVACKGECTAKAGASLKCEGKCTGSCKGSCTAQGGVQCSGKCEGTCKGAAEGGTGTGIKADGTCDGTCEGTCSVTAPGVKCEGSCTGECDASCTGTAEASVKCDGECKADFEPLKCEGGTLEGGCKADVKCDANCDASVSAKAECTPPALTIAFSGDAEVGAKIKATFDANLPAILSIRARLESAVKLAGTVSGNIEAVVDIKPICIPAVAEAAALALSNLTASGEAAGSLVVGAGGK